MIAPVTDELATQFGMRNSVVIVLTMSIFVLADGE